MKFEKQTWTFTVLLSEQSLLWEQGLPNYGTKFTNMKKKNPNVTTRR